MAAACGPPRSWTGLSPDHRSRYEIVREGDLTCVRFESRPPECYDDVALNGFSISADSRSVAFPIRQSQRWHVVHDGRPGPDLDGVGDVTLSPDGSRLAYTALRGSAWHVVVDGVFGPPFDSIYSRTLSFDPEGERVAFVAVRNGRSTVFLDERAVATHDGVAKVRFAPNGTLSFVARDGPRATVRVGSRVSPSHDAVLEYVVGESGSLAYIARDGDGWRVYGPGGTWGPYLGARSLRLDPGGATLFVVREDGRESVVRSGERGPPFAKITDLVVAPDGVRWGYVARDSAHAVVFLDGDTLSVHERARDLAFADAGGRYAFVAGAGDSVSIMHDRGARQFDLILDRTLQFTAAGCWTALVGRLRDRSLHVVLEAASDSRRFDWWEFSGAVMEGRSDGDPGAGSEAVLRAWVAAEAELIVQEGSGPPVRCADPPGSQPLF